MLEILRRRKKITVSDLHSLIDVNEKEFTTEQIDFIKQKKIFCLHYKSNYLITNIPECITHLIFVHECVNLDIINFLHENFYHIEFSENFNHPVDNLPSELKNVQFGRLFNQPVDNLPSELIRLQTGETFNHPIDKLPESLEILSFGKCFSQRIDNLPNNLKYIYFGEHFSYPIDSLPDSIETIKFACSNRNFNHNINKLPSNIKFIKLPWFFEYRDKGKIIHLKILAKIPESIEKIIFAHRYSIVLIKELNLPDDKIHITNEYY
jgi:hypothetical protein